MQPNPTFSNQKINSLESGVKKFQINADPTLKKKLTNSLSLYIRYYPRLAFRISDDDLLSEFYIYVLERMDNVLKKYDPNIGKLSTYLSLRLKTYWLNFLEKKKSTEKIKTPYELKEEYTPASASSFGESKENRLVFNDSAEQLQYHHHNYFEKSFALLPKKLNNQEENFKYLTLKLYFFDFFNDDDFLILKSYLDLPYSEVLSKLSNFQDVLTLKREEKMKWEYRLHKVYHKIIELQNKKPLGNVEFLKEKIEKERIRILDRYYQLKIEPPIKEIAKLLNEDNELKIRNLIQYQKKIFKKEYEKKR